MSCCSSWQSQIHEIQAWEPNRNTLSILYPIIRRRISTPKTMNRIMEKGDAEAIRKTMLIHEDVFKNQVRELHRLYRAQKMLTEELREKINRFSHRILRGDMNSKEHSGSCSGGNMRISGGFGLERDAGEDISTAQNTNNEDRTDRSTGHDRETKNTMKTRDSSDEDCEVELTLSLGGSRSKKGSKSSSPPKHKKILNGISLASSLKSELEKESTESSTR